jgi:ribosomal protein L7/L12
MFVPLWILVPAVLLLLWLLSRAFHPRGSDMIDRQRGETPSASPEQLAPALADPEVRATLAGGHKIEAIRLVRRRYGLDLKGAKDVVEGLGALPRS